MDAIQKHKKRLHPFLFHLRFLRPPRVQFPDEGGIYRADLPIANEGHST
jgi:hypothetical protein